MACVLFGWELGANRGHISTILPLARRLQAEGHAVHLALQQIDAAGLEDLSGLTLWQAPLWPRLLASLVRPATVPAATMGDILARLGLGRQGTLGALIRGWDAILATTDPQFVIADFAPALLAAAAGRVETAILGPGFTCPPAGVAHFPAWAGMQPAHDEAELLDIADAELAETGRTALSSLPALFRADHVLVTSFAELDPYAGLREGGHVLPVALPERGFPGGRGDEIFGYFNNTIPPAHPLWKGLAAAGRRVRLHMPEPDSAHLEQFRQLRFRVEARPLAFEQIAARSRIVISHGGHGFCSSAVAWGLPQMVVAFDIEKYLTGLALANAGLGAEHSAGDLDPAEFGARLAELGENAALAQRCLDMVEGLPNRGLVPPGDRLSELVSAAG